MDDICLCEYHPGPYTLCVCTKEKNTRGMGPCDDCLNGKHQLLTYPEDD